LSIRARVLSLAISTKILTAFAVVLALLVGLGGTALQRFSSLNDTVQGITGSAILSLLYLEEMRISFTGYHAIMARHGLAPAEAAARHSDAQKLADVTKTYQENDAKYQPTIDAGLETKIYGGITAAYGAYMERARHLQAMLATSPPAETRSFLLNELDPAADRVQAALRTDIDFSVASMDDQAGQASVQYTQGRIVVVGFMGVALLVALLASIFLIRSIALPIKAMTSAMLRLAERDMSADIPARGRVDEVGQMARAVQVFKDNMIHTDGLMAAAAREQALKARRQEAMDRHTRDFGDSITGVLESLGKSAAAMRASSTIVNQGAQQTRQTTSETFAGAERSARDLNSVAAAAEQLASSINEISRQVASVTTSVQNAVARAVETDTRVAALGAAGDRIGGVVALITKVASQTNLLALNATIEAARAGAAGKGFAVVASEVKALASQTAHATEQIAGQIVAIRGAAAEAIAAVRDVAASIGEVQGVAAAIAASVEEQAAATREITSTMQKVTGTTTQAAAALGEVLAIAESTDRSSVAVLDAAEDVARTAETLRQEVSDFLAATTQGEESERRLYERIPGQDATAELRVAGRAVTVPIRDISRGGALLGHVDPSVPGTDVEVGLPGGNDVRARIARTGGGEIGVAFRQDGASLARIDLALGVISGDHAKAAA
jgi:methyl-accepting chemotaxis protein